MTKITNFVWNPVDDCIISEVDETRAVQAVYTNEPQQYGGVISQRRGTTTSTYHADALGSTRFLTDSSGNVTHTYLNDAWGNSIASTGSTVNPFKWVGKYGYYTDDSTGQVYVRARMYQPSVARWSSFDPMGFVEGPNRAQYALSNPTFHVDKSGLACTSCCCCAEGIRGAFGVNLNPSTVDPNFGVGTYFELIVDIQLRPFQESLPCLLEYWEWASPNDGERGQKNCWRNSLEGQQEGNRSQLFIAQE